MISVWLPNPTKTTSMINAAPWGILHLKLWRWIRKIPRSIRKSVIFIHLASLLIHLLLGRFRFMLRVRTFLKRKLSGTCLINRNAPSLIVKLYTFCKIYWQKIRNRDIQQNKHYRVHFSQTNQSSMVYTNITKDADNKDMIRFWR